LAYSSETDPKLQKITQSRL